MLRAAGLSYTEAIVYALHVETFQDSDGDGVGDFPGLASRVDYHGVDPRLGTLVDVVDFLRAARERGIRVRLDLVVNHTSDQHPWFQAARRGRASRDRDWYV